MKTIKLFLLLTTLAAASFWAAGAPIIQENKPWSLLQIGIVPDAVALVPSDTPVLGINAELFYGTQQKVGIIDFQPIVGTTDVVRGIIYQGLGFNGESIGLPCRSRHVPALFLRRERCAGDRRLGESRSSDRSGQPLRRFRLRPAAVRM